MRNKSGLSPSAFHFAMLFSLFFTIFAFLGPVFAATTDTISFQSKLTNSDGTNISNGTYNFRFRMYSVASGGSVLWSEDRSLLVNAGVLSVDLGAVQSFPSDLFDNADLYLQVCFDANGTDADSSDANCGSGSHRYEEVFATRKSITAVPIALRAKYLTDSEGNAYGVNDFFRQSGNAYGATAVLGTTDAFGLQFITNGNVIGEFFANGDARFEGDSVSELFFLDASADRIGIGGTTTPDRRLEVLDTNPQLRLTHTDGSAYTDIYTDSNGWLYLDPSSSINAVFIGPSFLLMSSGSTSQINHINGTVALQNATMNGTSGLVNAVSITPFMTPSSGSLELVGLKVAPTIDQSGSASGSYTALLVDVVETNVLGTGNFYARIGANGNYVFEITDGGHTRINDVLAIRETGVSPTYYTTFEGGDQTGNINYILPTSSTNGVLTNTGGVLSWAAGGGGGPWTDGSGISYLTDTAEDVAIGGSTLAASIFGIDESAGIFYFGSDNSANPIFTFEATDADTGDFGFNTSDQFYISGADFDVSGHMALGANSSLNADNLFGSSWTYRNVFSIQEEFSSYAGVDTIQGITNYIKINPDANYPSLSWVTGGDFRVQSTSDNAYNLNSLYGLYTEAAHFADGSIGELTALQAMAYKGYAPGTGIVTKSRGAHIFAEGGITTVAAELESNRSDSTIEDLAAGTMYGIASYNYNTVSVSSGIDSTYGIYTYTTRTGATGGTINTYGQYIDFGNLDNAGAGTHTAYGIYIDTISGADTNYALYAAGGDSYFAGNVGIGTATPDAKLTIQGTNTSAVLGSELLTVVADRDFSSNSGNWTGTNWTVTGGVASHSTPGPNQFVHTFTATSGRTYQITATVTRTSSDGSINPILGNGTGVAYSAGGTTTTTWVVLASSSNSLRFVPDATWTGSIDNVSVKEITPSDNLLALNNSNGTVGLAFRSGGASGSNTFAGVDVGRGNLTGTWNTGFGYASLYSNTTGSYNAAFGGSSLKNNTTGYRNVAMGHYTLYKNLSGYNNVGVGTYSLYENVSGYDNVGVGMNALYSNTSGLANTGVGSHSLWSNTTGSTNTAVGRWSLYSNTTGGGNVAVGDRSLFYNISGYNNVGIGHFAARYTNANNNVAIGYSSLERNTTGTYNVALGVDALAAGGTGSHNVALGPNALSSMTNELFGSISAIENYDSTVSGTVLVTALNHSFPVGTSAGVEITDTLFYDGTYSVTYVDSDHFYMTASFPEFAIVSFSDYSGTEPGTVLVTINTPFVPANMTAVTISGTTYYDGYYPATYVSDTSFYITESWMGDDATGLVSFAEENGYFYYDGLTLGDYNLAAGSQAGYELIRGANNTFLGAMTGTGSQASFVTNSTAIGYGAYTTADNQIVLGNTSVTQTLIRRGTLGLSETGVSPQYYTFFQGGDQSGDITYTLPTASTNGVLTNTGGVLSWVSGGGGISQVGSMTSSLVFGDATADDDWLGLGASAGRIAFDDQTTDYINILNANVGIGDSSPLALLTVGSGDLFQIDSSGSVTSIDGIAHTIDDYLGSLRFTSNSDSIYIEDDLISNNHSSVSLGSTTAPWGNIYLHPESSIYMGVTGDQAYFYYDEYLDRLEVNGSTGTSFLLFDDFFVSKTSGNVGIGTTTPHVTFDVAGTGAFYAPGVKFITGSIDPAASTTVTGTGTLFLSEVDPGDRIALDGTATITGSIDPTASVTVTGVGTLFLSELSIGDQITVNAETRTVIAIASDTSLTVGVAFTDTANDTSIVRTSTQIRTIVSIESNTSLTVDKAFRDNSVDNQIVVYRDTFDVTGAALFKGGALFTGLGTPNAPTVTPQGTTGAATWTYKISAVNATGNETVLSANGSTATGNATLSGTNFNRITWSEIPGAASYRIYRVATGTSPNTTGYIGTVDANSTLQFDDTGIGIMGGYSGSVFDETSNVGIGTLKTPPRDTLTVDGRINQTWHYMFEDFFGGRANQKANAVINAGTGMSFAIIGTSGCTASFPSVANGVYRMTSGATNALGCLLSQAGTAGLPNIKQVDVSLAPVLEVVLNPGASTSKTMLVGFTNQTTATVAEPTAGLYFYSSTAGTPSDQWIAVARNASVSTTQPTGVTVNTNTYQVLRIEASATHARYYINDVLVADLRTNIPAAGATLEFVVGHITTAAAAKTVDIDSIEFWQDDPVVSGMPGQLPAGFNDSNMLQNHMLYSDTTYAKGASEAIIPEGYVVSYTGDTEFDDNGKNRLVYNIEKAKVTDKTVLGIGAGLVDPNSAFDIGLNPYAVALSGPAYAWVEEGGETTIELGQELRLSNNTEGVLSVKGGQIIARTLERVDWSLVETTEEGQPKRKLVKVFALGTGFGGMQESALVAGGVNDYFAAVDDTTIQTPYRIISSSLVATTADINVLKARTLNVNDAFMVDDEGNVSAAGNLFAGALQTPVINGVAGGLSLKVGAEEKLQVTVGDTTVLEASVKGVTVNNLLVSNQQAGKVTLPAGQTIVTVSSTLVSAESIVIVTPNIPVITAVKTYEGYFEISLAGAASQDVELGWYIVNINNE